MTTPEPEVTLLPCPFCGNEGSGPIEDALHVSHSQLDWRDSWDSYNVQCDKCSATMGYSNTEAEAIIAWNTRTTASQTPERCPRCRCQTFANVDGGGFRCVHCKEVYGRDTSPASQSPPAAPSVSGEAMEAAFREGFRKAGAYEWEDEAWTYSDTLTNPPPAQPAPSATSAGDEGLREALKAQMEAQADDDTPSSIWRERGCVWLEGWFDLTGLAAPSPDASNDAEISGLKPKPGHAPGCGAHDDYRCDCADASNADDVVERQFAIGEPVEVVCDELPEQWRGEWLNSGTFYIARIEACGDSINYTISDTWPIKRGFNGSSDLTDGFGPRQLRSLSRRSPVADASNADDVVERAAEAMASEVNFTFSAFDDRTKDKYRRMARAALSLPVADGIDPSPVSGGEDLRARDKAAVVEGEG